jgi:hypothetical protein
MSALADFALATFPNNVLQLWQLSTSEAPTSRSGVSVPFQLIGGAEGSLAITTQATSGIRPSAARAREAI